MKKTKGQKWKELGRRNRTFYARNVEGAIVKAKIRRARPWLIE